MKLDLFTNSIAFEDLDTDEPHAEIYAQDRQLVAIIRQTAGIDQPILEIWPTLNGKNWELDLGRFFKACENAINRLKAFQLPEESSPTTEQSAEESNRLGLEEMEQILRHPHVSEQLNRKGERILFYPVERGSELAQITSLKLS